MTLEQEKHLQELLWEWREERHLTFQDQMDGLVGNLCEEMAEYYRANNDDEKIDALCDMSVFALNSLCCDLKDVREYFEKKEKPIMDKFLFIRAFGLIQEMGIGTHTLIKFLYLFIKEIESEMSVMGYNFYECMLETIKEISSRTGSYDSNIHKFVKDKSEEAVKKWYKADYDKCKIKG
ncbi:hypothetical protein [Campylobacter ureolyticus]|uniref:Uncharacterized protein n=1 Tax=Campylobacter ureolyticus TaxID=827 RepID=A0A9Q4KK90_9BACT|nr:hypothetical protein [Campylobacter ureolyticus]MCZ6158990.1 hypothetical protein [Campylobacter ureolyticus]MDU4981094.1 hypothetical protein [Campylobacter ureolyticus]